MIYEFFLQKCIFPVATCILGRKFWPRFKELQKSQWLPRKKIEEMQLEKLQCLVKHAYSSVPLYKQLMDKAKVKPEDLRCLSDIEKLPIVTKDDFRKGFPERCTSKAVPRKDWLFDSTSGSTGSPFQFIRDYNFSDYSLANTYRTYTWTGMKIGNKSVFLWGAHKSTLPIKLLDGLLRRRFMSSFDVEINYRRYYDELLRDRPFMLEAYSASVTHFAKLLKKEGLKSLHIPAVISSAETLYPENRRLIEEALHTKVFNRYGSREVGNVAHECEKRKGLHVNAESYIIEVVSRDGKVLKGKDKKHGRLIITNLTSFAMPFIRYDTEDYGVPSDRTCTCGRGLPLLENIEGRVSDFILMPNGKELSYLFFNYFFEQYGAYLRQFQVIQDRKDHLLLRLVVTKKYNLEKEGEIIRGIKNKTGRKMRLTISKVKRIEPEKSGKTRPVKRLI
ncbi:phenylacetate--CoA ligase family protein [Candidatus Woesearchaeota archaeon]|nr:phenylacetate--CoA ligase family protein [Candidatus Woesearchaeota archaeon]